MIEVVKFEYCGINAKKKTSFGELSKGSICLCSRDNIFTFKEPKLLLKLPENSMEGPLSINAYDLINEKTCYIPDTVEVEQFTGKITLKGENVYKRTSGIDSIWIKIVSSNSGKIGIDNKKDNNNAEYNVVIHVRDFISFIAMDCDRMKEMGLCENNIEVEFNFN